MPDLARAAGIPKRSLQGYAKDGHCPSLDRAEEICGALGLELRIGPPRGAENQNIEFDYSDFAAALGLPASASADEILAELAALADRAKRAGEGAAGWREIRKAMADIRREISGTREALRRAGISEESNVYRLEPQNDAAQPAADESSRPVAIMDCESAAGDGRFNLDSAPVRGRIWFTRAWLDKRGLYSDRCVVIGAAGESMEPTLPDGCSILVDRSRCRRRVGAIFVIETGDGLIVKRLGKSPDGAWRLVSDNSSADWPPMPWPDDARVAGQVMWMARSL